jgi:hypothetical protein
MKGLVPPRAKSFLPKLRPAKNKPTIDKDLESVNSWSLSGRRWLPYLWAGAVTLLIAAPWLAPGYLFGTDWPGPRFIRWPTQLSSSAPLEAILAAISTVLSAEITAKILVLGSLFVAALAAYTALPYGDFVPRAAASLIYVVNPFVYGRLHYGQLFLIAGYAVLPWVALRIYRLFVAPTVWGGLWLAVGIAIVGMLTLHLLLVIVLLLGGATVSALAPRTLNFRYLAQVALSLGVAGVATLLLSAYWLVPYVAGRTDESRVIATLGAGDLAAYTVVRDPSVGLARNLLGLYGFWAEGVHRFPPMKFFVPHWDLVMLVMVVLAGMGAVSVFVIRSESLRSLRWWVVALVVTGLIGLILEAGVAEPRVAPFIRWLDAAFPPYRGMRDSGKWGALLAVVYAQLIPLAWIAIRGGLKGPHPTSPRRGRGIWPSLRETSLAITAGLALSMPLYYGNGLLFGMHRQIQPSQYPAGWYTVDRVMSADGRRGRALFLPWHQYLRLSFVRNVNSIIASPAPEFFSIPILVSENAEVEGIPAPGTPDQRTIQGLVSAGGTGDWARGLRSRDVRFVVVAKELDWRNYAYLDHQVGLIRVGDYGSVVLYRVRTVP